MIRSRSPSPDTMIIQDEEDESIGANGSKTEASATLHAQVLLETCLQRTQQQQWDIELATEIGHSLMIEIKRMQDLLQAKNNSLSVLSLEKMEAYQKLDDLTNQLKQRSNALDRGKEDNWTLELEKQELAQQVEQLQYQLQKTLADQTRYMGRAEELTLELENLKQQHIMRQQDIGHSKKNRLDLMILKKASSNSSSGVGSNDLLVGPIDADQPLDSRLCPSQALPTPSASCPLAMVKHVQQQRQQRQQHNDLVALNATLQSSLRSANVTIQELQHSLDNEQKKRMEMETLWRENQEAIEQENNLGNYLITDSFATSITASPTSPFEQMSQPSPSLKPLSIDTRHTLNTRHGSKQQAFVSLGDELSMAGSKDEIKDAYSSPEYSEVAISAQDKLWSPEILSAHTNLHDSVVHDFYPTNVSSTTIKGDDNCNKKYSSITEQPTSTAQKAHDDSEPDQDHYGTLWSAGSYVYHPPTSTPHPLGQRNDTAFAPESPGPTRQIDSGDTRCIRSLTRTMIGDWMWKYTRKVIGRNWSEKRHKRFFWLHPYSKTLHWSTQEPGVGGYQFKSKSVTIESFLAVNHGGLPCFYIQTSNRDIKIQCMDESRFKDWARSLSCLLMDTPISSRSSTCHLRQRLNDSSLGRDYGWTISGYTSASMDASSLTLLPTTQRYANELTPVAPHDSALVP